MKHERDGQAVSPECQTTAFQDGPTPFFTPPVNRTEYTGPASILNE